MTHTIQDSIDEVGRVAEADRRFEDGKIIKTKIDDIEFGYCNSCAELIRFFYEWGLNPLLLGQIGKLPLIHCEVLKKCTDLGKLKVLNHLIGQIIIRLEEGEGK